MPAALRAIVGAGRQIDAYSALPDGGWVYSVRTDGCRADTYVVASGAPRRLGPGTNPSVDPSGRVAAVAVTDADRPCATSRIAVYDVASARLIQERSVPAEQPGGSLRPAFSSAGAQVLFLFAGPSLDYGPGDGWATIRMVRLDLATGPVVALELSAERLARVNEFLGTPAATPLVSGCLTDDGVGGIRVALFQDDGAPGPQKVVSIELPLDLTTGVVGVDFARSSPVSSTCGFALGAR